MKKRIALFSVIVILLLLVTAFFIASVPLVKSDTADKPDLVVWNLGVRKIWFGCWYRLTVQIKNVGEGGAGDFYDKIWWDDTPLNYYYHEDGLPALEIDEYYIDFCAQKGGHTITVCTDYYDDVVEENENNNCDDLWYYYWWIG